MSETMMEELESELTWQEENFLCDLEERERCTKCQRLVSPKEITFKGCLMCEGEQE